jgi:hypothetical protein
MRDSSHLRGIERAHQRDQGEVSSWRFRRAETVSGPPAFPAPLVFCWVRRFQRSQGLYHPPDFLYPQGFLNPPDFLYPQGFLNPPDFLYPQGFLDPPDFLYPQGFLNPPDFLHPQGFLNPPDFPWQQVFVHFSVFHFCILF